MIVWLLACTIEVPDTVQNTGLQREASGIVARVEAEEMARVNMSGQKLMITLPTIERDIRSENLCLLQEMPPADVGLIGVQHFIEGAGLEAMRVRMIEHVIPNHMGQWIDCDLLGEGYFSRPIFAPVHVTVQSITDPDFNGLNLINLPEGVAFPYVDNVWVFETLLSMQIEDIDISFSFDLMPRAYVERFAGIFEMEAGFSEGSGSQSVFCPVEKKLQILSLQGYSEPNRGTFSLFCDERELYSVDAKTLGLDRISTHNFANQQNLSKGCRLTCEREVDTGELCAVSMVVYPLDEAMICFQGDYE